MLRKIVRYFDLAVLKMTDKSREILDPPKLKGWSDYVVEPIATPPCAPPCVSRYETDLYFEAHITLAPAIDADHYNKLQQLARENCWRVSKLFLKNGDGSVGDPWHDDMFLSARSKVYRDIENSIKHMLPKLEKHGFEIRRYKIENTLTDVKYTKCLTCLGTGNDPHDCGYYCPACGGNGIEQSASAG
jgi:hypothetical protein